MSEFIGARISLVSNSDIRYVGTLHEINSETSTVALENVSMLGTEGRRPENEVAPLDSIYEYILFRGTDVKDLRIEEAPITKETKTPQVPNDPAILGSGTRPTQIRSQNQPHPVPSQSQAQQSQVPAQNTQTVPQTGASFGQHPQFPQFYSHPTGWGRNGTSGPGGYPPIHYASPPGWYPGLQQGFSSSPQFAPFGYPTAPPGLVTPQNTQQNTTNGKPAPIGAGTAVTKQSIVPIQQPKKSTDTKTQPKAAEMPAAPVKKAPTPPVASKPSPNEVKAAVSHPASSQDLAIGCRPNNSSQADSKTTSRVKPAVPLRNISAVKEPAQSNSANANADKSEEPSLSLREATQAASAAVAAAMAKLNTNGNPVNEKGPSEPVRNLRKPSGSSYGTERTNRGGQRLNGSRGGMRGASSKIDVPKEDFDFESANAKFSKQELIKEAVSGSPTGEGKTREPVTISEISVSYNKATSFFDNISTEVKDRQESGNSRQSGREWRGEEQKKNLETFGQESIDNGYRGGHRGRGRGRGGYRRRGIRI